MTKPLKRQTLPRVTLPRIVWLATLEVSLELRPIRAALKDHFWRTRHLWRKTTG